MKSLFIKGVFILGGIGLLLAWDSYDKKNNYYEVTAIIERLESSCYLEKKSRGLLTKKREWTSKASCDLVRRAAELPKYEGYEVRDVSVLHVRYRDSEGRQQRSKFDGGKRLTKNASRGAEVQVLVNKSDPEKLRKI